MLLQLEIDETKYSLMKIYPPRMEFAPVSENPYWTVWISIVPTSFSVSWYGKGNTLQEAYDDAVTKLEERRPYLETGTKIPTPKPVKKPVAMPDLGDI